MSVFFRLRVEKIEQACLFNLSWGQGQEIHATVAYPTALVTLYQDWQRIYLNFYKTIESPITALPPPAIDGELRSRVKGAGGLAPVIDWRTKLVEAETRLLNEFHCWLRGVELFEIRAAIASQAPVDAESSTVDLFITCSPLELARFPWELWEVGADFATTGRIRILRTSPSLRRAPHPPRRRRARILAILGDDTGLNFQVDRKAVQQLSRMAEVQFVGWQPGQTAEAIKTQVQQAIADEQGWDMLLFAGHSNETAVTGGELAIAPNVSILIREIAPQLIAAQERGLQFALFNSCSGLNIAESLIELGFNQVAVMREPIHNRVAQEFLVRFLHQLAIHQNVRDSFQSACQVLRLEKNLTYPSAYLVPSLFGHPGAVWYQIPSWKAQLRQLLPNRLQAAVLATCIGLSLLPSAQTLLLDQRLWVQSLYRNWTAQVPNADPPPIALVQIDRESIQQAKLAQLNPLDRRYLATLIDRLIELNTRIIGIDYLLDVPQPNSDPQLLSQDQILAETVESAVQQGTWFVFASALDAMGEVGVSPATGIANPAWSLQGFTNAEAYHVMLLYPHEDCRQTCPFAYNLAIAQQMQQHPQLATLPQQQWQNRSTTSLRTQTLDALDRQRLQTPNARFWDTLRFSSLSVWAYEQLNLHWFAPVVDYSIPPHQVYDRIAAWGVLDAAERGKLSRLPNQIVIVAAGVYDQAGLTAGQGDAFKLPSAIHYWRQQFRSQQRSSGENHTPVNHPKPSPVFTGGEQLAYMTHHVLQQHFVIPVPDLCLIGLAALLGKGAAILIRRRQIPGSPAQPRYITGFAIATGLYGLASLQLYISAAVLLPWLLPSTVFWVYLLPVLRKAGTKASH